MNSYLNKDMLNCVEEKIDFLYKKFISKFEDRVSIEKSGKIIEISNDNLREKYNLVLSLDGKSYQNTSPSVDNQSKIENVGGIIEISINGQKMQVDLADNELCSIEEVKDNIVVENGRTKIIKKIGKLFLTGSENWLLDTTSQNNVFYLSIDNKIIGQKGLISTNYTYSSFEWQLINDGQIAESSLNNCIFIRQDSISTIADFKKWLSAHNIIVYYVLSIPVEIELGSIYNFELSKGKNVITNNINANMSINLDFFNVVLTQLRGIKENDSLSNKTLYLSIPRDCYKYIGNETNRIITVDDTTFIYSKQNSQKTGQYVCCFYNQEYLYLYYKYNNRINQSRNYIRYKLPKKFGVANIIDKDTKIYQYINIKDDEYKLLDRIKKTWNDNDIPYLQDIDKIEEKINALADMLEKRDGYEYKTWTTTGHYNIGKNDYGLAQRPISQSDFYRWEKNIALLDLILNEEQIYWNLTGNLEWDKLSEYEWED